MEMMGTIYRIIKQMRFHLCAYFLVAFITVNGVAQSTVKNYTIKNGKMYIELGKQINNMSLDSFIAQYNLNDLPLKEAIHTNSPAIFKKLGWKLEINNNDLFVISKPLFSVNNITSPEGKIMFAEKHPTLAERFPAESEGLIYGYNRFKNKLPFAVNGSDVTFYLRNNTSANHVILSGSFNSWSENALQMIKTDSGWIVHVKLNPGKYWYKFIIDGTWSIDHDNKIEENDGMGNINSVFYKTNYVFGLNGYQNARRTYLTGSFNNWRPSELQMTKTINGWELPLYLANGTHTYKFVVDGKWIADPDNLNGLPDGQGDFNSVIRIGTPYLFKLNGYTTAKQVFLAGSFNHWRKDELYMDKTATGWQLNYTLGAGNYEYRFIVDGREMIDPLNPLVTNSLSKNGNSFLVIDPNFTFRLNGFAKAKTVILSGDFDDWSPYAMPMKREGDEWACNVHLYPGKHLYKFVVDGKWIIDPANKLWEQNEYGTANSLIWVGN
jgi:Glycogen recognition site of AMP-activated protein kinase